MPKTKSLSIDDCAEIAVEYQTKCRGTCLNNKFTVDLSHALEASLGREQRPDAIEPYAGTPNDRCHVETKVSRTVKTYKPDPDSMVDAWLAKHEPPRTVVPMVPASELETAEARARDLEAALTASQAREKLLHSCIRHACPCVDLTPCAVRDHHRSGTPSRQPTDSALECDQCGSFPARAGLIGGLVAGDQCPCLTVDGYDCDGTMVSTDSQPTATKEPTHAED